MFSLLNVISWYACQDIIVDKSLSCYYQVLEKKIRSIYIPVQGRVVYSTFSSCVAIFRWLIELRLRDYTAFQCKNVSFTVRFPFLCDCSNGS